MHYKDKILESNSQMSGFEPSLPCFCAFFFVFFSCFFGVGKWVNRCLSNVLFTTAVGLQMSGSEYPLLFLCVFFALFSVFWGWMRGVNYCCCSYSSILHSIPKIYLFLAFQGTNRRVTYFFFGRFSNPENSQKNPGYHRPTLNTLYQVTPREYQGNRWPCSIRRLESNCKDSNHRPHPGQVFLVRVVFATRETCYRGQGE